MFHLLWSVVVGLVVGVIARALVLGPDRMGLLATAAVGVAGSLLGGLIARLVRKPAEGTRFHPAGFFMSVIGAIILLLVLRQLR